MGDRVEVVEEARHARASSRVRTRRGFRTVCWTQTPTLFSQHAGGKDSSVRNIVIYFIVCAHARRSIKNRAPAAIQVLISSLPYSDTY